MVLLGKCAQYSKADVAFFVRSMVGAKEKMKTSNSRVEKTTKACDDFPSSHGKVGVEKQTNIRTKANLKLLYLKGLKVWKSGFEAKCERTYLTCMSEHMTS